MPPPPQVEEELGSLGISPSAIRGILDATKVTSLEELEGLLGPATEATQELRALFRLMEAYGFGDYLQFDASCVRGLAYYTGMPLLLSRESVAKRCLLLWRESVLVPSSLGSGFRNIRGSHFHVWPCVARVRQLAHV